METDRPPGAIFLQPTGHGARRQRVANAGIRQALAWAVDVCAFWLAQTLIPSARAAPTVTAPTAHSRVLSILRTFRKPRGATAALSTPVEEPRLDAAAAQETPAAKMPAPTSPRVAWRERVFRLACVRPKSKKGRHAQSIPRGLRGCQQLSSTVHVSCSWWGWEG